MKLTPMERLQFTPYEVFERPLPPSAIDALIDGKRISEMSPDEYLALARKSVKELAQKSGARRKA
jgi:hypothetical protein